MHVDELGEAINMPFKIENNAYKNSEVKIDSEIRRNY
jgi:hypothetical protein